MRHLLLFLVIFLATFLNCQHKLYQTYTWGHFNVENGDDFVNKVAALSTINRISIVDTKADGNEFRVNGQEIFLDTSHTDMPNYYSYIKRAKELNIAKDSLLILLKSFYKIGVNEFIRQRGFYQFPVVESAFTTERGYFYAQSLKANQSDTIPTKVGDLNYRLVLVKQLDKNWFEYFATR
jgi:hypothetical protein